MGKRAVVWGLLLMVAGVAVGVGFVGSAWSPNARLGAAVALETMGLLFLAIAVVPWILRRTTNPEDYKGGCPVGVRCACGHFNFKPRALCKTCGAPVTYP